MKMNGVTLKMLPSSSTFYVTVICILLCRVDLVLGMDETVSDWVNAARAELRRAVFHTRQNKNLAKNVILFIGDGMGLSTITAARIHAGQMRGESGEENRLYFERFPHVGLMKTYNADEQVPDSAASGSALLSGVKINYGVIGLDSRVKRSNCSMYSDQTKLKTILHRFTHEGLSTGIVTNSRITHATPAAAYAHTPNRAWEGDANMARDRRTRDEDCDDVEDIAKQLIMRNKNIKVIMGGGRRYFMDNSTVDPETNHIHSYQRKDGLNLIDEWIKDKKAKNASHSYVWNKNGLENIDSWNTDYVLGLFHPSHMDYEGWPYNNSVNTTQPNLIEMTRKAIRLLRKDTSGYFLLVEGARIDWGHHANSASRAIRETIELDEAVKMAVRMTNRRDTLILVTADHSHAFAVQGYSARGKDILGKAQSGSSSSRTLDGIPYTTLGYTNGRHYGREDITNVDTTSPDYKQPGCIPMRVETHAGEDVPAYGLGPMAHLLHSTHEQHYLYHLMEYATCLGWSKQYCGYSQRQPQAESNRR